MRAAWRVAVRWMAAVAAFVLLASALLLINPGPARAVPFTDVAADEWFAEAVDVLSDAGIIAGRGDGTFGPQDPVTRGEFAVLVTRGLNLPFSASHPFIDFPHGVWFEPAVGALYQAGLTTGMTPTEYAPYRTVSREQAVSFAVRALAYRVVREQIDGLSLVSEPGEVEAWLQGFADRPSISGVHRAAAANAVRLQLLAGQPGAGFRPRDAMTRAETAGVLYAALFNTPAPLAEPPKFVPEEPVIPAFQPAFVGSRGPHILWLEQRLTELTFRPGPADGVYDERTRQAVIAFQKWEGLTRDGVLGSATWSRLLLAGVPSSRVSASGTWIEVHLAKQVFLYVQDGTVTRTLPTSTGRSFTYRSTPYTAQRKSIPDGPRYRAIYLNPGNVLAIHGYPSVPIYPASDGCIRLPKWDMDDLRANDATHPMIPNGTKVYIAY